MATRPDIVDLEQRLEAAMEMKLDAEDRYDQALGRLEDTVGKLKNTTQRLDDACIKVQELHHKIQVIREYSDSLMRRRRLALSKAQAQLETTVLVKCQKEALVAPEKEQALKQQEQIQAIKGEGGCKVENEGTAEPGHDESRNARSDFDNKPKNRRKRGRSKSKRDAHSRGSTPVRVLQGEPSSIQHKKDNLRASSPVHGLQHETAIVQPRRNSIGNCSAYGLYSEPYNAAHARRRNSSRGNSSAHGLHVAPFSAPPFINKSCRGNIQAHGLQLEPTNVQMRWSNSSRGNSPARVLQAQPYNVPLRRNRGCSPSRSLQVHKYKLEHSQSKTPVHGTPVDSRGKSPMCGASAEPSKLPVQAANSCEWKSEFEALTCMKVAELCTESSTAEEAQATASAPLDPADPNTCSVDLTDLVAASNRGVDSTKVYINELSERLTRAQQRTVKAESSICFLQIEIGRLGSDLIRQRAAHHSNNP